MARLEDYANKYQTIKMERRDGILQMTFHTDGGPLQWGGLPTVNSLRPFEMRAATPATRSSS